MPSNSKVVMVLGFYETRKKVNPPSNLVQGSKLPVVVLRFDKPSPKVIWPEKQDNFSNPPVMMELDSQQTNMMHSKLN